MAAFVTTNIASNKYTAPSASGGLLSIIDGSNTYKIYNTPEPSSTKVLMGVGKTVFGSDQTSTTVFSSAYKVTDNNGNITWDLYVAKLNNGNTGGDANPLYASNVNGLTQPGFAESLVGLDLNNDGTIGPKDLTVVSQTIGSLTIADTGDQLLAKDAQGYFYFLDKDTSGTDGSHKVTSVKVGASYYDPVIARDSGGSFLRTDVLDYSNGTNSTKAVAVVKSDVAPPSDMGYSTPSQNGTAGYYVMVKSTRDGQSKPQWEIKKFTLNGEQDNSFWNNQTTKVSQYETFFGQDLNGDGETNNTPTPTAIVGDSSTDGVIAGRNIDGDIFIKDGNGSFKIVKSSMGSYTLEQSYDTNETKVIAATDTDQPSGTYLLAVKNTQASTSSTTETVNWDVYTIRTKAAFLAAAQSSSGTTGTAATSASMLNSSVGDNDLVLSTYGGNDVARGAAIGDYEIKFGQDLNGDGTTGLNKANIKAMSSDTQGVRLERDDKDSSLFIAEGTGSSRNLKAISGGSSLEYSSKGTDWANKREAIAVEAIRDSSNTITGYKLALKRTEYSNNGAASAGPASTGGGGTAAAPKVTWDIYELDLDGKIKNGAYDDTTHMWKDNTVWGAPSATPFEAFFGEDLNGDGKTGIDTASLSMASLDKSGVKLGRDADKSLYIVDGTRAKAVGNASWLESSSTWDNGSFKNEAMAVEAVRDTSNVITGYKLAMRQTNTYQGTQTVSWDVLKLDVDGKVTYGYYDSATQSWLDESIRGQKSIAAYETLFGDDLNGDGSIGVDVTSLVKVSTDTNGILLARDKDNSLYLLDGNNAKAITASWLEYSNSWGGGASTGSNKKEAIAVEAVRNNAGTITGYKLALKQTDVSDGKTTVSWDVVSLTKEGALQSTSGAAMATGTSQTKSISAYEDIFNQDLNNDGHIGIDVANLTKVSTDTTGLYLARDAEKSLYIVNGNSAKAVGNSSWLEYDNNWGTGSNKREAIAVEAVRDGNGNITAYKLAMKQTNNWNGKDNITWDVLHLNTEAQITYGAWSSTDNKWVDNSVYGVKSMVAYETLFNQDLNEDGHIGIDVTTLKLATSDTRGVRLARDKDNALFIVDGAGDAAVAKAIGNASWLEYDNSWTGGSNKMEALAVEATRDNNNTITGYKLGLKQTNDWNGVKDENYQVLNLDTQGNVNWGGTAGATLWTKKVRQVESLINEDLNNDGTVGVTTSNLTTFAEIGLTGADDRIKLAQDSTDKALYIMNNGSPIALMDSFGGSPELAYSRNWGSSGTSTAEVMGVAKQTVGADYQFRIAVKVTNTFGSTSEVSWQIHTVSKDGVLDWSKVATARSPGRFESIFGQDLDGVTNAAPTAVATDTDGVKLYKDDAGVLYIYDSTDADNNGMTYLVDAQGGSPSFDFDNGAQKSSVYAVNKLSDGSYRLAVKKTVTATQVDKWEVYTVGARVAASDEATINRAKTAYLKDVRDVEALIHQDINADGTIGRPADTRDVADDDGAVKAALTSQNQLYINNNGTKIAVVDGSGVGVILNKSESWDSGASTFLAEVVAAEKVDTTVGGTTTRTYKIAVRETTTLKDQTPGINWKIFTTDATGVMTAKPVETKSIARWETLFNQDMTPNVGSSLGVDQASLTPLTGDSDVALDADGAVYVRNSGNLIQVTDITEGSVSFESVEKLSNGFSTSHVVAAQTQDSGAILMAIEFASKVGDVTAKSWIIHTLDVQGTGASAYAAIDWTKAVLTDDMTDYAALFGQTFSKDVATLGA